MSIEPEAIGLWAEVKLQIIREYAAAHTTILKEQSWCKGYAYIDAWKNLHGFGAMIRGFPSPIGRGDMAKQSGESLSHR